MVIAKYGIKNIGKGDIGVNSSSGMKNRLAPDKTAFTRTYISIPAKRSRPAVFLNPLKRWDSRLPQYGHSLISGGRLEMSLLQEGQSQIKEAPQYGQFFVSGGSEERSWPHFTQRLAVIYAPL